MGIFMEFIDLLIYLFGALGAESPHGGAMALEDIIDRLFPGQPGSVKRSAEANNMLLFLRETSAQLLMLNSDLAALKKRAEGLVASMYESADRKIIKQ